MASPVIHFKSLFGWFAVFCGSIVCLMLLMHGKPLQSCEEPCGDRADYIFISSHFWHQLFPSIAETKPATPQWGKFLSSVPFRQIGVGSIFLFARFIFGEDNIMRYGPYAFMGFVAAVYAFLVLATYRRLGSYIAAAVLVILVLTSAPDYYFGMSEGWLRMLFLGMLAWYFTSGPLEDVASWRMIIGMQLAAILLAHVKAQWLLLGLAISAYQAVLLLRCRDFQKLAVLLILTALVPLSLIAVNWFGWQRVTLTSGYGMHAMWKRGAQGETFIHDSCGAWQFIIKPPRYCKEKIYTVHHNWGVFMDSQYPDEAIGKLIDTLDEYAIETTDHSFYAYMQTIKEGLPLFTNFPAGSVFFEYVKTRKIIDALLSGLCLLGFCFMRTRFLCYFAVLLWLIPLWGYHVAEWDPRYLKPMAGVSIIAAIICLRECFCCFANFRRRLG